MKTLTNFFSSLYRYATICIVVATPLFFIPKTGFSPDFTYHITLMVLVAIALFSYVVVALMTRTWQSVSRLEFLSYFVFSIAVLASTFFSKTPQITLFGEAFNQFSGAALLTLPVIMYLVRSLPETLRHKLKLVMVGLLAVSSFLFINALMLGGGFISTAKFFFSGFSSSLSFAVFVGLFPILCFYFIKKSKVAKKWKAVIALTAVIFIAFIVTVSSQNSVRPNFKSTTLVGKEVLLQGDLFGLGAGNFARAWQLHRPQDVILSPYFGYDFNQGADTMTTFFVTIGILGLLAFMMLVLSALYNTVVSYRQNKEGQEHIVLGVLTIVLFYFVVMAWMVPFTYSMLVMWMVISGLGLAKTRLTEFHPSKKLAFLFIPILFILTINAFVTINKARAFSLSNAAQSATKIEDAETLVTKAATIYNFDGFYRLLVEYAITFNRNLLSTASGDQEALKDAYLKKAQAAVDAGLVATNLNRNNYQNFVSLGRAYELAIPFDKERGFAKAKESYQNAIKLYPNNPYLYLMLARLETSAGTREGVRAELTDALKKKQNFADALYLMSQLEASESNVDEALLYAIEAIKSAPNDPATYVQAGLLLYAKKDYENAVFAFNSALEKDPNNANVAYFLALTLRDGGRPDLAKPLADELLRRNPGNKDLESFINSLIQVQSPPVEAASKSPKAPQR